MGRQPGKDDDWDLSGDDLLAEVSPVNAHRGRLFQRIERQRAAYFADVEDESKGDEGREDHVYKDDLSARSQTGNHADGGKRCAAIWFCRSVYLVLRRIVTCSLKSHDSGRTARWIGFAGGSAYGSATTACPCSASGSHRGHTDCSHAVRCQCGQCHGWGQSGSADKKRRRGLLRFCWRLLRGWLRGTRRVIRLLQTRRPTLQGHEMLMERMRERSKRCALRVYRFCHLTICVSASFVGLVLIASFASLSSR